jgi:hypothetical protein
VRNNEYGKYKIFGEIFEQFCTAEFFAAWDLLKKES